MHDWLYDRARVSPDETGLVRAEDGEAWTFAELDDAVRRTAGRLAAVGVKPGDHLGMVVPARPEAVLVVHAAMRLGVTLVPMGERLTARELGEQIEQADVTTLVCDADTEPQAVEAAGEVPVVSIDRPQWEEVTCLPRVDPVAFDPAAWRREDALLILFTSGTSGSPKAVTLTFWNLLSSAVASVFRLGTLPGDRWLVPLSLHHMGGIGPVLRGPLYGTTVVVRDGFDPGGVVDDIDRHEVTGVSLVPTMLKRMLELRGTLSDTVRVVLLGGAPAPTELLERCRNYSIPVYPTYGMTETASQIATARPEEAFEDLGTVGRPLLWTDLRVVDEDERELPPGEVGEFVVSGPTVTPGYYGDSEATDAAFCPYGLKTGDVGYRDGAGRVYVLNRKDDRILTGGENVDPGEVVRVVRSHPDVDDVAVVGLPDPDWGQQVAALVVPANDGLTQEMVEGYCRESLAGFKVPKTMLLAPEIPRTVSGTVDREAVREQLREVAGMDVTDAETGEPTPLSDDETPQTPTAEESATGPEAASPTDVTDDRETEASTDHAGSGTATAPGTAIPDAESLPERAVDRDSDGPTGFTFDDVVRDSETDDDGNGDGDEEPTTPEVERSGEADEEDDVAAEAETVGEDDDEAAEAETVGEDKDDDAPEAEQSSEADEDDDAAAETQTAGDDGDADDAGDATAPDDEDGDA